MIFDEEMANNYDRWFQTPQGRYIDRREKDLILDFVSPRRGERLLDVGCGTGEHLVLFKNSGCNVTGIDSSAPMLAVARQKLGHKVELLPGKAEDLPFSDNEFDIVTMILSLEFTDDPEKAISEAIRVSRGRVFLGVLNKCSATALQRRVRGLFHPSIYKTARFYHVVELKHLIRSFLPGVHIRWGSVIFLPNGGYGFAAPLEEAIPVMKNPLGAFLGLSFPVNFTLRTVQNIIGDPFKIKANGRLPAQGIVREGKFDSRSHPL
ncbi:MAG: methyltransferase domain-containing protein [Deltaproteobacteria bacterium]|nr:methyltransferase domain-containing protein [Deltaproteobacteria bacterium]